VSGLEKKQGRSEGCNNLERRFDQDHVLVREEKYSVVVTRGQMLEKVKASLKYFQRDPVLGENMYRQYFEIPEELEINSE
jgi:hypothetical protein